MVTIQKKNKFFDYRVAVVIVDQGRVLLSRAKGDHFWSLPSGLAQLNEQATDAIKRVILAGLEENIEIDRLLWIVESFFREQEQNKQHHELGLYFLAHFLDGSPHLIGIGPFLSPMAGKLPSQEFQWFPQNEAELKKIPIYPLFLKYKLDKLPDETEHVINQDRSI